MCFLLFPGVALLANAPEKLPDKKKKEELVSEFCPVLLSIVMFPHFGNIPKTFSLHLVAISCFLFIICDH